MLSGKGFSDKRYNTKLCIQTGKKPPQPETASYVKRKYLVVAARVLVALEEHHY